MCALLPVLLCDFVGCHTHVPLPWPVPPPVQGSHLRSAGQLSEVNRTRAHTRALSYCIPCPPAPCLQAIHRHPEADLPTAALQGAQGLALLTVARVAAGWSLSFGTGEQTRWGSRCLVSGRAEFPHVSRQGAFCMTGVRVNNSWTSTHRFSCCLTPLRVIWQRLLF